MGASSLSRIRNPFEQMRVQRACLRFGADQRVDFLCRERAKSWIKQHCFGRNEALIDQQRIYGVVARHVPSITQPVTATREVAERTMHGLVREHELSLGEAQSRDVFRIEVDPSRIGRDRCAPACGFNGRCNTSAPMNGLSMASRARAARSLVSTLVDCISCDRTAADR